MSSMEGGADVGRVDVIDRDSFQALFDDIAGHLNAQHGRLIDLTAWLLEHPDEWQGDGVWTPHQFLAWRCGIGSALAANVIAAAERAAELPASVGAVRCGELSLDQLMPIVRGVPSWADGQVVSLAKRLTVSQIRRLVKETDWSWHPVRIDGASATADASDAGDEDRPIDAVSAGDAVPTDGAASDSAGPGVDANRVSHGYGPDGRWYLHADLDTDLGALFESALDEARDAAFVRQRDGGAAGVPFSTVSDVDGLIELAERSLDTVTSPSRRNRYRVNLYLESNGRLATDRSIEVPRPIAQFLTCDGRIDPVVVEHGHPVSVGRSQRTIPDRTRRTVLRRDGRRCQLPGCTATRGLDLHHIIHWSDLGPTDTWNLLTVCSRHHRMHHRNRLGISGDADDPASLVFTDARGRPIRGSGVSPAPPGGPPRPTAGRYEHPLGERLDRRWVTFVDPSMPTDLRHRRPDVA